MSGPNLPVALYVRVSSEEQVEGYSLDAQERAGHQWCTTHGAHIVRVYREEGRSARTDDIAKRPAFQRMLADVEAGLAKVVLVHKLDRFARNRRVAFDAFDRLGKAGVGFVSIAENLDYSTPAGQLMLTMLVGLSQFYSDNLSFETRKGKAERKAQGLYNGLLPFGFTKNSEGLPSPDSETYPGLLLAFQLAAEGKSDREVAEALSMAGYRTTGNRGANLFTKDTVRVMLRNRFYLGELPDGEGGWVVGKHDPVIDTELFAAAQRARRANQRTTAGRVNRRHRRYSLSGLAVCGTCGGRLHFHTDRGGQARVYCYQQRQSAQCGQRSAALDGIEEQVVAYLRTFTLPEETVLQVIALYDQATAARDDGEQRRRTLAGRLERIKELYAWGDLDRATYMRERDELEAELATACATTDHAALLVKAADFLRDLAAAWEAAEAEQRNELARLVFQAVEIKDDRVIAVVPQPDFAPFFLYGGDDPNNETGQPLCAAPDRQTSALAGGSDGLRARHRVTATNPSTYAARPPGAQLAALAGPLPNWNVLVA